MKKLTFTLLFALMAIFSAQAAKVYLKIGEGRVTAESDIAVWAWDDSNKFCTNKEWPGDKLTEKETIEGADYFVYTVNTEGSYNIIFNNNEKENANTNRTADILGLAGDYTFVLNNEWDGENWSYTKTEGAPGAETPESVETYTVQLRGNAYGTWNAPVTFAYNAETKEYVYEETETAKLADDFKVTVNNTYYKAEEFVGKALDNSLDFVAMNDNYGDMKITDAADYDKITLTVKNDNGTWKLKVVGEKPDKVQIAGEFNSWNGVDMVSNPNGTYTYEVEENMNALSEGFGIVINGVFYAGNTVLDLDGDAVVLTGNPGHGNDLTLIAEGDVASVILTVAKDGDNWTVKAATGKTSSVQLRGNAYGTWNAPVTFAYNAETKEYVYEETETAKLADDFKVTVNNTYYKAEEFVGKALDNSLDFVAMNDNYGDMKITDAADYDKITLTVKNDNGTWKLKVVGEKPDKVQIAGEFNSWNGVDMVSNPNGTYTYEVEENMNALSEGFGIVINGVFYAGNTVLDLDGDAVVLTGNPGHGNDLTLIAEGDVASVILTVAKDGDNWTVKAATGKTSSVAGVDAAGVVIAAANGEIVVDGAQSVAVYTAAGALVSTDARTRVAAGLYIVRADNVVKKVIVK